MSTASHQLRNATTNAGVPPAPHATHQGAGGGECKVQIESGLYGLVEDPYPSLEAASKAFGDYLVSAHTGPVEHFGDIVRLTLLDAAGNACRRERIARAAEASGSVAV